MINTEALGISIDDLYTDQTNQTTTNTATSATDNILINLARMERESNTEIYESLDQVNYCQYNTNTNTNINTTPNTTTLIIDERQHSSDITTRNHIIITTGIIYILNDNRSI
jgi:hypothetical protein